MRIVGLILTVAILAGLASAATACPYFVSGVRCLGAGPMPGKVAWEVSWIYPGSGSCCETVRILEQDNCTGPFYEVAKVPCTDERYVVIDFPGQKVFKLEVYRDDGTLRGTYTQFCTECD